MAEVERSAVAATLDATLDATLERCAVAATPDATLAAADIDRGLFKWEAAQEPSSPAEKSPQLLQLPVQGENSRGGSAIAVGCGSRDPMCCTQGRSPLHSGYYSDGSLECPMSPAV